MNIFWYDFKLSLFFKMKHKIYKEFVHFHKFILIKNLLRKKLDLNWGKSNFFHNKLQKKSLKNHSYEKNHFGEKRHVVII